MASTEFVMNTLENIIGRGPFYFLGMMVLFQSFSFMYINAHGIKKLDAYFENGKDFNDTWSRTSGLRYLGYCNRFIMGKLKVSSAGLRWWMYCNALGYLATCLFLVLCTITICYLELSA